MRSLDALPPEVRAHLAASGGFLLAAEASRLGVSRRTLQRWLRDGTVERVVRGVYGPPAAARGPDEAYRRRVRALLACHGDRELVVAGPAAAVLHGLPLIGPPPGVVHVAAARTRGRRRDQRLHRIGGLPPDAITLVDGVPTQQADRAVLDTARLTSVTAGVAAADAALRRGLASADGLAALAALLGGRHGAARARRTAQLASPLSESPGESWSAVLIDAAGLPAPVRQQDVHDDAGLIGRVDFWWPEERVVGEFDGRVKYRPENTRGLPVEDVLWEEKRREDRLRATGVAVVRWTTADLRDPGPFLARLRRALGR